MFKLNKFLTSSFFFFLTLGSSLRAQEASFMPVEMIAGPGESKTNNISSGQSESLRVGTSSSFGANVSISSSGGYLTEAYSSVKALNNADSSGNGIALKDSYFQSSIGGDVENPTTIKIDVTSLRKSGSGSHQTDVFSIDSTNSSLAEGDAEITGISASSTLEIDPSQETYVRIKPREEGEFSESQNLETANSNAGQNLSNSLNVDITNTEFKNAFSQAF